MMTTTMEMMMMSNTIDPFGIKLPLLLLPVVPAVVAKVVEVVAPQTNRDK
jgi:hypothetical protein